MMNNDFELSEALKRSAVLEGDIVTLKRKTRADIPNANGYVYTKDAFDNAMIFYTQYRKGPIYLAPVTIEEYSYDINRVRQINSHIYQAFHEPVNNDYKIGRVTGWDDYTISFQIDPSEIAKNFIKYIIPETSVNLRYVANSNLHKNESITSMNIVALDLDAIPYAALDIDIDKIDQIKEK